MLVVTFFNTSTFMLLFEHIAQISRIVWRGISCWALYEILTRTTIRAESWAQKFRTTCRHLGKDSLLWQTQWDKPAIWDGFYNPFRIMHYFDLFWGWFLALGGFPTVNPCRNHIRYRPGMIRTMGPNSGLIRG